VGDVLEEACDKVVVAEELLVAFKGGCGDLGAPGSRFQAYWTSERKIEASAASWAVPPKKSVRKTSPAMEESSLVGAPRESLKFRASSPPGLTSRKTWRKTPC
jgi:hypothetical protein